MNDARPLPLGEPDMLEAPDCGQLGLRLERPLDGQLLGYRLKSFLTTGIMKAIFFSFYFLKYLKRFEIQNSKRTRRKITGQVSQEREQRERERKSDNVTELTVELVLIMKSNCVGGRGLHTCMW